MKKNIFFKSLSVFSLSLAVGLFRGGPEADPKFFESITQSNLEKVTERLELESPINKWKRGRPSEVFDIIASGDQRQLVQTLIELDSLLVLSKDDRQLASTLIDRLVSEDPEKALQWLSQSKRLRYARDFLVDTLTILSRPGLESQRHDLISMFSAEVFYDISSAVIDTSSNVEMMSFLSYDEDIKEVIISKHYKEIVSAAAGQTDGQVVVEKLKEESENPQNVEFQYVLALSELDPEKALHRLEVNGEELPPTLYSSALAKIIGQLKTSQDAEIVVALINKVENEHGKSTLLSDLGLILGEFGENLEFDKGAFSTLDHLEKTKLQRSFSIAKGIKAPEDIPKILNALGSSSEAANVAGAVFGEIANDDAKKGMEVALNLKKPLYRKVALDTVIQTWASADPESSLSALAELDHAEDSFFTSWIQGVKNSEARQMTSAEILVEMNKARNILGDDDFDRMMNFLKDEMQNVESSESSGVTSEIWQLLFP